MSHGKQSLYGFVIGLLLIGASLSAKEFKGGEYRTFESFTYGRFEVRMKSVASSGMLSSFFTYHDGGMGWNEIDVEILGRTSNEIQFNTITPGQVNHVYTAGNTANPHTGYHVYAFEWTPEYVAWFIDGNELHRQTGAHIAELTHAQKIMMNIWQPDYPNWVGSFDREDLPLFVYYDWVKYHHYSPGEGDYGSNNDFSLSWTDNFSNWDQERWGKATHTFGGNNADFIEENVSIFNGNMILCLTEADDLGYDPQALPFDQEIIRYNSFENGSQAEWIQWTGIQNLNLVPTSNPLISGINLSSQVINLSGSTGSHFFYSVLAENLDLSENHTFTVKVLGERADTRIHFALQNSAESDPAATQLEFSREIGVSSSWTNLYFEYSQAVNHENFDRIAIWYSNDAGGTEICYFDDVYGPPNQVLGIENDTRPGPKSIHSLNNFPNPFNNQTMITFTLESATWINADLMDVSGRLISNIISQDFNAGNHQLSWSVENVASGIYLIRIADGHALSLCKKVVLLN